MPERNVKQCWLIPSARAIPNPRGTAPGWWVERDGKADHRHARTADRDDAHVGEGGRAGAAAAESRIGADHAHVEDRRHRRGDRGRDGERAAQVHEPQHRHLRAGRRRAPAPGREGAGRAGGVASDHAGGGGAAGDPGAGDLGRRRRHVRERRRRHDEGAPASSLATMESCTGGLLREHDHRRARVVGVLPRRLRHVPDRAEDRAGACRRRSSRSTA